LVYFDLETFGDDFFSFFIMLFFNFLTALPLFICSRFELVNGQPIEYKNHLFAIGGKRLLRFLMIVVTFIPFLIAYGQVKSAAYHFTWEFDFNLPFLLLLLLWDADLYAVDVFFPFGENARCFLV